MLVKKDTVITWLVIAGIAVFAVFYFLFNEGFIDAGKAKPKKPTISYKEVTEEEETIPCTVWTDEYAEERLQEINTPKIIDDPAKFIVEDPDLIFSTEPATVLEFDDGGVD